MPLDIFRGYVMTEINRFIYRQFQDEISIDCISTHNLHPPFILSTERVGEGVEPPTKFSKKRGRDLRESQFLEGGCWKRGGDFF